MGWWSQRRANRELDRALDLILPLEIEVVGHGYVVGDGYKELARYNDERARGLLHTPEWDAKMAEIQERFNAEHLDTILGNWR